jgi:hypothetical protein
MNYKVETISVFDKQAKRLAKKYRSLKDELITLVTSLSKHPTQGTSLGNGFYKVRISIGSKGKGKSGGARIITYVKIELETVYLVAMYDKSEMGSISEKELNALFIQIPN